MGIAGHFLVVEKEGRIQRRERRKGRGGRERERGDPSRAHPQGHTSSS